MLISLDTETTGIDLVHGAMAFLVTTCADDGRVQCWEWDVNPLTRRPDVLAEDVVEITALIDSAELIYAHNAKFDVRALATIGIELPWAKVRDTLIASHLLASNSGHRLDELCLDYLNISIDHYEEKIKKVTQTCRAIAKRDYPTWRIAKEGMPDGPSVQDGAKRTDDKPWKGDMWLPRALAKSAADRVPDADWITACAKYANADSEHTLLLGMELEKLIQDRGLWAIYEHRLHLPRIACEMEDYGVTARGDYTAATIDEYEEHCAEAEAALHAIAASVGHRLELAEGAALNDNMRDLFYGGIKQACPRCTYVKRVKHWNGERVDTAAICPKCAKGTKRRVGMRYQLVTTRSKGLELPVITKRKTGNASLDKAAIQDYLNTLDEGPALDFVRILADKRGFDTALSYLHAYRRFWLPLTQWIGTRSGDEYVEQMVEGYYRIHASLNPCGTDHLRWASNSPNLQNVSKRDDYNLRACFGPAPGREWWAMDFQNIELRIPAYESGEPAMIEIFEAGEAAPYWGSYHNLIASIVYADEYFADGLHEVKDGFKKKYKATLYQYIKNFNFAKQYGCGKRKGDATARKCGAFEMVDRTLSKLSALQAHYLSLAERTGFITTLPDRSVDETRGYPILAGRTEDGRVLSTTPFNYHVSGTACWAKNTALIRCAAQCEKWRAEGFDAHVALEIHDEILFDFPRGDTPQANLPRALLLKGLMEQSGEDLIPRIPSPVSIGYHAETWAKETAL